MSSVIRRKSSALIGLTPTAVGGYSAPASAVGVAVTSLTLCNVLNGPTVLVTVAIFDGTNTYNIVKQALVMQGGNISVCDEGTRIGLNANDQVIVTANQPNSIDVIMTVTEIN